MCLWEMIVDLFRVFCFVVGICCEMLYDSILVSMLDILLASVEFVLSLVLT